MMVSKKSLFTSLVLFGFLLSVALSSSLKAMYEEEDEDFSHFWSLFKTPVPELDETRIVGAEIPSVLECSDVLIDPEKLSKAQPHSKMDHPPPLPSRKRGREDFLEHILDSQNEPASKRQKTTLENDFPVALPLFKPEDLGEFLGCELPSLPYPEDLSPFEITSEDSSLFVGEKDSESVSSLDTEQTFIPAPPSSLSRALTPVDLFLPPRFYTPIPVPVPQNTVVGKAKPVEVKPKDAALKKRLVLLPQNTAVIKETPVPAKSKRSSFKRLPPLTREALVAKLEECASDKLTISDLVNLLGDQLSGYSNPYSAVDYICDTHGLPHKSKSSLGPTEEDEQTMEKLWKEGKSSPQILGALPHLQSEYKIKKYLKTKGMTFSKDQRKSLR